MNRHRTFRHLAVVTAALLALAGCGGGGGNDSDDEPESVPDGALASPESFTSFVGAREASESREPLAMNAGLPPTSETAEPVDLD